MNYGDIIDAVATVVPDDRAALIHGDQVITWGEFTSRTNRIARNLLAGGAVTGDKVAFYTRNRPEYLEGLAAAFKARLTHVNVNYRYIENELLYLLDNADATVCLFAGEFSDQVSKIQQQLPKVKQWIQIDDGYGDLEGAIGYEDIANSGDDSPLGIQRESTDQLFIYTGGTTGMPKGVMWSHDALWNVLGAGGNARFGIPPCEDLAEHLERVGANPNPAVSLPLPPLMHGTGLLSGLGAIAGGGTVITLTSKSFEAPLALELIQQHKVTTISIVGDAFARPLVETLDANPGKYDISSVGAITSSGVMWTRDVKAGLLRHNQNLVLGDGFSSSEAIGLGSSVMTKDETIEVAKFSLGPNCKVFTEEGREVKAGSGERGMIAVSGFLPDGYYKDQEKTDKTFKVIDGVRYSIPGDFVEVEADGSLTLLGRGSNCINTAGEKVFPEEVEEAMKFHESVADCLVVGLADEKWGQSITAVVQLNPGYELEEMELKDFARQHLAAYKLPKRILVRGSLERAPNGKANYKLIQEFAEAEIGAA
ncbi:MAG: acyl-CoA synthetase (AMP-forming)/AMP-acid ligase II [Candidatus Azotimanducaceae bacterium]|jgi:acyl-CoA synthetase (AMP-forming)/AMP-acid ligase II